MRVTPTGFAPCELYIPPEFTDVMFSKTMFEAGVDSNRMAKSPAFVMVAPSNTQSWIGGYHSMIACWDAIALLPVKVRRRTVTPCAATFG